MSDTNVELTQEEKKDLDSKLDAILKSLGLDDLMVGTSHTTADAVLAQVENSPEAVNTPDYPKQMTNIPKNQGEQPKNKKFDADITSNQDEELEPEEAKKQSNVAAPIFKTISEEEYAEYQALKQAKLDQDKKVEQEQVQKSQEQLIKMTVEAITKQFKAKEEELQKSILDMQTTLNNIAKQPKDRKSVGAISVLEKSVEFGQGPVTASREQVLDALVELALNKSVPDFTDDHVAEYEMTGTLYDKNLQKKLEQYINRKKV